MPNNAFDPIQIRLHH